MAFASAVCYIGIITLILFVAFAYLFKKDEMGEQYGVKDK